MSANTKNMLPPGDYASSHINFIYQPSQTDESKAQNLANLIRNNSVHSSIQSGFQICYFCRNSLGGACIMHKIPPFTHQLLAIVYTDNPRMNSCRTVSQ